MNYNGFKIVAVENGYLVDGVRFTTEAAARAYIDAQFL